MEVRRFHKGQLLDAAVIPVLFDTIEHCDALRDEARQIVADTKEKRKEALENSKKKADLLIKGTNRHLAKREAELEAQRDEIIANTAIEHAAKISAAITRIEASVADLVVQSLQQLFDAMAPNEAIVATIRRAIKQHHNFEGLTFQLNPTQRDAIEQALGPEYGPCLIPDPDTAPGDVRLVSPGGTVDLSPKVQIEGLASALHQIGDDTP